MSNLGPLIQLAAIGKQNEYVTGNPQITFFKSVYMRHTPFAIEQFEDIIEGANDFGNEMYINIKPYGDLVHEMYVHMELPEIKETKEKPASWTNSIGHAILKLVEVIIGGITIDRHFGEWLEIWGELTVPASKRDAYYDLIGHKEYFDCASMPGPLNLYVPLYFWFNKNIGMSLPLIALQNHLVQLRFTTRTFDELYVSATGEKPISKEDKDGKYHMKQFNLLIDYIYLDDNERRWFANTCHDYLIDVVYNGTFTQQLNSINNVIQTEFNHLVKEIIWVIQDCQFMNSAANGGNEWFNFSDKRTGFEGEKRNPMISAKILMDGEDRLNEMPAKFFSTIIPFKYHTYVPDKFINVYSFAINPESSDPTGSANYSQIDFQTINVKVREGLVDLNMFIYAPTFNILRIEKGMAGLLFQC